MANESAALLGELLLGEQGLQAHQREQAEQLPDGHRDVLEARPESAPVLVGRFGQVGGAGRVLPPTLNPCMIRATSSRTAPR